MKALDEKNGWRKSAKSPDHDIENFRWLLRLRDRIDEFHEMVLGTLFWEDLIETAVEENRVGEDDRERLNDAIQALNTYVERIQGNGRVPTIYKFVDDLGLAKAHATRLGNTIKDLRRSRRL